MSRILDDPKKVKALIKSETRSTRAQGGNPYYIPEGITLDEHYDLAMEAGMDPQEYVRRNYHGISSSQPYPHQAHILHPRRLVPRPATKSTSAPGSNNLLQRTSETMGISDSAIPPSKRAFLHSQEEELSFDNASSPPEDQTRHPPHTTISSVSAKIMPSPHLPLGELVVKKPRREVQTDLDRINTPVQTSVLETPRLLLKDAERFRENEIRLRYELDLTKQLAADNFREEAKRGSRTFS